MGNSASQEEEARKNRHSTRKSSAQYHRPSADERIPTDVQNFDPQQQTSPSAQRQQQQQQRPPPQPAYGDNANGGNPLLPKPPTTTTSTTTQVYRESSFEQQTPEFSHVEKVEPVATPPRPKFSRQKSAIVLETEHDNEVEEELERMKLTDSQQFPSLSRANSGEEVDLTAQVQEEEKYDTKIEWKQGGSKVYVTGSFTGWRQMIRLTKHENGEFGTTLRLPAGTHRLRFLVDNELKCSDDLPTATDSMGNLVNYIQVGEERPSSLEDLIANEDDDLGENYERVRDDQVVMMEPEREYGTEIPEVFTNPEVMDKFVSSDFVTPPVLPPHLEGVILNSDSTEKDNNSILPIPNHVVLNHLATTSIKHNVLAVASISRYSRKYVTQVLYAPLQ